MLKYALYKGNLPQNLEKYTAITQVEVTASLDDLISDMTSRGSTLTRAEALSTWEELTLAIKTRLARGENISTPLFYISQDIQGEFESADDTFRQGRNIVVFNISPSADIKEVATKTTVQKVEPTKLVPTIKEFTDFASNTHDKLTKGNTARITGTNLKTDTADATQGVFFIAVSGGAEVKVATLMDNQPSVLTFQIPATLPAGNYKLEVRAKINRTKELRVSAFNATFAAL